MGSKNVYFTFKDIMFKHPFNMFIVGASGSGKTEQVHTIIKYNKFLIYPNITNVLYCYGVFNQRILDLQELSREIGIEIKLHEGLPSEELIRSKEKPLLLILDDLMIDIKSKYLTKLFTRDSHHNNMSIIFISQAMFEKELKTARNNAHYIMLMRNPAGELQIRNLGVHLFPRKLNYFMDAYEYATQQNFGYLIVDLHPISHPILKLRTNIYPGELPIVFSPK